MLHRRVLLVAALFGACLSYTMGRNAPSRLQEELVRADRGIWEAIAGPHPDMDQVSAALAPDYIDIDSGVRHSRREVMAYLRDLTKFSFQYRNVSACVLSPTSGYVIAELSYSSIENGAAATGKVLTTTVFSKEHGKWMAHLHTEMDVKPDTR